MNIISHFVLNAIASLAESCNSFVKKMSISHTYITHFTRNLGSSTSNGDKQLRNVCKVVDKISKCTMIFSREV